MILVILILSIQYQQSLPQVVTHSCFIKIQPNIWYKKDFLLGENKAFGKVRTLGECMDHCMEKIGACQSVTYFSNKKLCFLHRSRINRMKMTTNSTPFAYHKKAVYADFYCGTSKAFRFCQITKYAGIKSTVNILASSRQKKLVDCVVKCMEQLPMCKSINYNNFSSLCATHGSSIIQFGANTILEDSATVHVDLACVTQSKLYHCDITKYGGLIYMKDEPLYSSKIWNTTFQDCVDLCLSSPRPCAGINFIWSNGQCSLHGSAIRNIKNVSETEYRINAKAVHASILCNDRKPPNKTIGCGIQAPQFQPNLQNRLRIINGQKARTHSWPWQAHLSVDRPNDTWYTCGASLLRVTDSVEMTDVVITAAHCLVKQDLNASKLHPYDPSRIFITAGDHKLFKFDIGEQHRVATKTMPHPLYKTQKFYHESHDIAMVLVDRPFIFSDTVRPICLPKQGENVQSGHFCVVSGWGRNSSVSETSPDTLHQLIARPQPSADCYSGWSNLIYSDKEMICAGVLDGSSNTCFGDSGGPLQCLQDDGRWILEGLVSIVPKSPAQGKVCLIPHQPGIFARVSNYVDWIEDFIERWSKIK